MMPHLFLILRLTEKSLRGLREAARFFFLMIGRVRDENPRRALSDGSSRKERTPLQGDARGFPPWGRDGIVIEQP